MQINKLLRSRTAAVVAGVTAVVALTGTGAVAGQMIGSPEIRDGGVKSVDIASDAVGKSEITDEAVGWGELNGYAKDQIDARAGKDGADGAAGTAGTAGADGKDGLNGADGLAGKDGATGPVGPMGPQGPKGDKGAPGLSNLIAGAGYTDTWVGDGGASLQTARGECPAGQYALGGGFSTWGGDKDLGGDNKNIQVTVSAPYFEGEYIPVDEAGNFRPTEWVIKGYNNGTTDQIVRPWVVCATVN